jgi:hypothetical protein
VTIGVTVVPIVGKTPVITMAPRKRTLGPKIRPSAIIAGTTTATIIAATTGATTAVTIAGTIGETKTEKKN